MSDPLEIDALGLLCPLPVLRLRKRIAGLPAGSRVALLADDPVAVIDIPHFCNEAGHEFVSAEKLDGPIPEGRVPQRYLLVTG
ncbi:sulfurtransferase TusA family protein [Thalassovita sp.]|uniref:sulfurtransferase TusA family protein n=1 Tax=Thalassovita sp. TaxID=1979401 RepID=UPI002B2764CB|nr:sulfurtransferase TusA family protein [Thalassovita sp.]